MTARFWMGVVAPPSTPAEVVASKGVQLSIHDDGRGFDVESMREHPRLGIGLRICKSGSKTSAAC